MLNLTCRQSRYLESSWRIYCEKLFEQIPIQRNNKIILWGNAHTGMYICIYIYMYIYNFAISLFCWRSFAYDYLKKTILNILWVMRTSSIRTRDLENVNLTWYQSYSLSKTPNISLVKAQKGGQSRAVGWGKEGFGWL
jgi:hypothetical protein